MRARRVVAAGRIWEGSGVLARRIRRRLARWIAAGRRTDLTGWQAVLGCVVRAALVLLAAGLAVLLVRGVPISLWFATPAWVVAAYRAAPRAQSLAEGSADGGEEPLAAVPPSPGAAFARWLLQIIGGRPGIHLYELYPAMRQLPGHEALDDTALRAALRTLGVTVTRSLRVPPVEGRSGVRREDVQALLPPGGEHHGETGGDAGQPQDSPALSGTGDRAESA